MSTIIHSSVRLKTTTCYKCHVAFAMPEDLYNDRLEDKNSFYCPNGHGQVFTGKSEKQRLREEKEQLERRVSQERTWRQAAERRTEAERRSTAAVKGHLTRAKKRAHHAVCPYCPRTFANVQRHIDNMHPEHSAADHAEGHHG